MPNALRPTLIAVTLGLSLTLAQAATAEDSPPAAPASSSANDATADSAAGERPPLAERSVEAQGALQRQLPAAEQQQLQAADETFLALWKPANVAAASGVVILVPASGESADWPQAIGPLRNKLPDAGWSSLSLTLPDLPQLPAPMAVVSVTAAAAPDAAAADVPADPTGAAADAPAADGAAEQTPAATSAPAVDPSVRIFARIQAAIAFAEQQQAPAIVLLGHGDGAYWAARFLAEQKPPQVKHLLSAAAVQPSGLSPALDELLPGLLLPTGDFYYKDQAGDRSAATRRLHASKRLKHEAYSQIALKALPGNPSAEQEQLYRRIRGWLDKSLPAQN